MERRRGREVGDRMLGITLMAVLMPFCNLVRMSGLGSNRKILGGVRERWWHMLFTPGLGRQRKVDL